LAEREMSVLPASSAAWTIVSRRLNASAMTLFISLEVIAIALGLMVYVGDPFGFVHRQLAFWSLLGMACFVCVARGAVLVWPLARRVRSIEVVMLFGYATLLTQSMGAANSPFIALYAITLLAAALLWEPVWIVVLAILIFGFTLLQTGFLDLMDERPLFAIVIVVLDALLPAAIAGVMIAVVRQIGRSIPAAADQDETTR
jgi:hypothetical protein